MHNQLRPVIMYNCQQLLLVPGIFSCTVNLYADEIDVFLIYKRHQYVLRASNKAIFAYYVSKMKMMNPPIIKQSILR